MIAPRRHLRWFLLVAWAIALAGAFAEDRQVAQWVKDAKPINKDNPAAHHVLYVLELPGYFPATLCVAGVLAVFHRRHLHAGIALVLTGVAVGAFYSIGKWIAGRHRPVKGIDPFAFHPFPRGIRGLFQPEDALCFPSGHASLAFASAMCLTMLLPRAGWIFFSIATLTAAERVIENAHYMSDVVAGAGMGMLAGWLVTRAVMSIGASNTDAGFPVLPPDRRKM